MDSSTFQRCPPINSTKHPSPIPHWALALLPCQVWMVLAVAVDSPAKVAGWSWLAFQVAGKIQRSWDFFSWQNKHYFTRPAFVSNKFQCCYTSQLPNCVRVSKKSNTMVLPPTILWFITWKWHGFQVWGDPIFQHASTRPSSWSGSAGAKGTSSS